MAKLPILQSGTLKIAPFAASDISDRYIGWLNDPEVVRYSEQRHCTHTAESCAAYFQVMKSGPSHFCTIRLIDQGRHIGNISTQVDRPNATADVSILIGERDVWGRGYGLQAWSAVMEELLHNQGFRKVTGGCMAENRAMISIMRRAGMQIDYVRPRAFLLDGREIDSVHFAAYAA